MSGGVSGLSDEDLMRLVGQQGSQPAVPDVSSISDADLLRLAGHEAPTAPAAPATAPMTWGQTAADVARSVGGGLSKGVAGLAGLPADLGTLAITAKDKADAYLTGRDVNALATERNAQAMVQPSTIAQAGGDALNKAYGYDYKPETTAGKYADTVASFVPGAALGPGSLMRRFALGAGIPGLASEAAGQVTAGTDAEPYARVAAALASPAVASRAITPIGIPAARAPLVATLDHEAVPMTAGQRTGSMPLQWMESMLSDLPGAGAGARNMMEQQQQGLNRAVGRRFGSEEPLLTPDVMRRADDRIGNVFEDVSTRHDLQYDPQLGQGIADTIDRYGRKLPSLSRETFGNLVTDLRDQVIANGGTIPGPVYQQARSDMTKIVQGARNSDPLYADAVRGLRDHLDGAFERTIAGTEDAGRLSEARHQYAAMKTAEKALSGPGGLSAEGNIPPKQFSSAVRSNDKTAYVRGQGDMADLARAVTKIEPLPNSGTNPRNMANSFITSLGAMGAGLLAGAPSTTVAGTGAAAMVLPAVAGRAIMSRPVQAYLGNNLINGGEGLLAPGLRAVQGYEDAQADPLMLRVHPRR
jgi:hypothetical protein